MRSWRTPTPLAWLLLIAGLALFVTAGVWQYGRAELKRERERVQQAAQDRPERPLAETLRESGDSVHRVRTVGRYLAPLYLLDNQVRDRRLGVEVFALFESEDAGSIVVALGWLPYAGDRRERPELPTLPNERVQLQGLWSPPPAHGLRFGRDWSSQDAYPKLMPYFDLADIAADARRDLAAGVLHLAPEAGSPYRRDRRAIETMPPERHLAYALQWWSLALAIMIVFIFVHRPRKPS